MFDDGDDEDFGGSILEQLQAVSEEEREAENYIEEEELQETLAGHVQQLKEKHQEAVDKGRRHGHMPVLLWSSLQFLFQQSRLLDRQYTGTYVDCTFGRGGFSREMLARLHDSGRLFALDIDPTAVKEGRELEKQDPRFRMFHAPFSKLNEVLEGEVDGVVMDIGISNPQVSEDSRGFSLQNLGEVEKPADMRMNPAAGMPAMEWLQTVSAEQLAWVLYHYGPSEGLKLRAERTAQAIIDEQKLNGPNLSMNRLCEVIAKASGFPDEAASFEHPYHGLDHPARLFVQAIRMFLNQELEQLELGLDAALKQLVVGGRLLVTSFKQSESNAIMEWVLRHEEPDPETRKRVRPARRLRELYPLVGTDLDYAVKVLGKPTKPSAYEITQNKRARSGNLFVLEKVPRLVKRQLRAKPRLERTRFKEPPRMPIFEETAES